MFGFYTVAAAVNNVKVADTKYNASEIVKLILQANKSNYSFVIFPELSITGYTCGDLFLQKNLLDSAMTALSDILENTKNTNIVSVIGVPISYSNTLYNCAVVIQKGKILGVIPKTYLPNHREFYEKRWFSSSYTLKKDSTINILGFVVAFGSDLLFEYKDEISLGIEICEDLWAPIPQSSFHALAGANLIVNLSSSNELVCKSLYRKELVTHQSAKCMSGYVYVSSGIGESSSDLVFGGHAIIAENGYTLKENNRFANSSEIITSEVDFQKLSSLRKSESSFFDNCLNINGFSEKIKNYRRIEIEEIPKPKTVKKKINKFPFVPKNPAIQNLYCTEIFNIQSSGLGKRLLHTKSKKVVIGISGGLDSTLALLVIKKTYEKLNRDLKDVIAVTMPGFGTSSRTLNNAILLCKEIGCELKEIDIRDVCLKQMELLNLDTNKTNTTYENVQARQRTMILMNMANEEGGIVIGTGDLSEIALGWSTYNGDHMSMYSVNCGVPKTLIRYIIKWYAFHSNNKLKKILLDIIDTPVSPELIPSTREQIDQKTEEIIGPYELHDFFLYHMVRYGANPKKILYMAELAFKDTYKSDFIKKYLKLFVSRFFSQQFKRNCIPDGPKVGTIALSPRGDWRMPSDASADSWLKELD